MRSWNAEDMPPRPLDAGIGLYVDLAIRFIASPVGDRDMFQGARLGSFGLS